MKYSTGYVPDPDGHKRTPFHRLSARLFAGAVLAASVSLTPFAPPVMDQGSGDHGTGSCTGHAVSCATATSCAADGRPLPFVPSPAEAYRNGRAVDRDPTIPLDQQPLADEGAQPNQVWRAASEFGVTAIKAPTPDGRYSDADPSTINDEPKLGDLETESLTLLVNEYGITSKGAHRVLEVKTAINGRGNGVGGKAITAAIAGGSEAFQAYSGGVLSPLNAELDHYVTIVGYRTLADGSTIFEIRNSWSENWGEAGNVWINEAALDELGDLVVADVEVRKAA